MNIPPNLNARPKGDVVDAKTLFRRHRFAISCGVVIMLIALLILGLLMFTQPV